MVKKWFLAKKWALRAILAEDLKNDSFWTQNHFFAIITPKPDYIYLENFSWENFSKKNFGPLGPPLGYLGSLSQNRLGKIFSKCGFLNLLSPLGLPIPSYALLLAKKIPRECVLSLIFMWSHETLFFLHFQTECFGEQLHLPAKFGTSLGVLSLLN